MRLAFRTKTILGIVLTQAVLLLVLIVVGLAFMRDASEQELRRHAATSALLFATTTRDAVLTEDLAALESAAAAALRNPEIVYVRVRDRDDRVLAAQGDARHLARLFRADTALDRVTDGIYDVAADIQVAGKTYGQVELGLSVDSIRAALARTAGTVTAIAVAELLLAALVGFLLGTYLTRQLAALRRAALQLSAGGLGHQVAVHGSDELADTARALNRMSADLEHAVRELREREQALNEAQAITHVGHWDWDFASGRQEWSAETRRLFGVTPDAEVSLELFLERVHPDDRERLRRAAEAARHGGLPDQLEYRVLRPDGTVVDIHYLARLRHDDAGHITGLHGTVQDVTERKRAEAERSRLSSALRQAADSILITDRNGVIEYVNPAFETTTGYSAAEAVGRRPNLLKSGAQDQAFYERLWKTILSGEVFRDVLTNRRKDGTHYFEEKHITPIRDDYGQITHFVSTGRDITDRIRDQESLRHMAYHDPLTGLLNRSAFHERLRQAVAVAERRRQPLAVLYIDLDGFKEINDSFGHAVGDELLREVAARLRTGLRVADTVARLGGDEFAVIMESAGRRTEIEAVAGKLLAAISAPAVIDGRRLAISASIGIALFPEHADNDAELLRKADSAMYRAKRDGGRRICIDGHPRPGPTDRGDVRE